MLSPVIVWDKHSWKELLALTKDGLNRPIPLEPRILITRLITGAELTLE